MKSGKITLSLIITSMISTLVLATDFSYSNLTVGYISAEVGGGDSVDADGFDIEMSGNLSEDWFGFISYHDIETDSFSGGTIGTTDLVFGAGSHTPISDTMDFVATFGYSFSEVDVSLGDLSGSVDGYGFVGALGVRKALGDKLELGLFANYSAIEYDHSLGEKEGFGFLLEGRYFFTDAVSLGVAYETVPFEVVGEDLDIDEISISARFDF